MVCEKAVEQTKVMDNGSTFSNSAEQAVAAPENGTPPNSTPSTQCAASNIIGDKGQESVAEKDIHNQPSSYYNYYYPGYNGSFAQSDDGRDHSSMVVQGDHGSIAYYMPGYNPYAAGTIVGADGQCVSQAYYTSSGYPPVTYGAEALPCYAWDMSYFRDPSNGSNVTHVAFKDGSLPTTRVRSNGIKPSKFYGSAVGKRSTVSSNPKLRQYVAATPTFSQPKFDNQHLKPLNKSAGFANSYHPVGNFHQSLSFEKRDAYANNGVYRSNGRMWNGNDNLRSNRKSWFEMPNELTCGPRGAHNKSSSSNSSEKEQLGLEVQKDKYNLADFQTEYETAKFYVIKSYSEDDVQKCLKYAVWSSTPNGNKKLDAAFHDAEKASETGTKCPIFLFFSVNASGQFVGVAEMTGKVDFNKNMDFWQLNDKWSGFMPIKWHIVKDVPNSQLRHILLENNENRPVTYTRDTQEIGLKQGLEMLKIFKNYSSKTSLQDDFEFYEERQKAFQTRNSSSSGVQETEIYRNGNLPKQMGREAKVGEELSKPQVASVPALVNLTKNLTLNSDPKVVSS